MLCKWQMSNKELLHLHSQMILLSWIKIWLQSQVITNNHLDLQKPIHLRLKPCRNLVSRNFHHLDNRKYFNKKAPDLFLQDKTMPCKWQVSSKGVLHKQRILLSWIVWLRSQVDKNNQLLKIIKSHLSRKTHHLDNWILHNVLGLRSPMKVFITSDLLIHLYKLACMGWHQFNSPTMPCHKYLWLKNQKHLGKQ